MKNMKKIFLIVYDSTIKIAEASFLNIAAGDRVILFPLTSHHALTARLKELFLAKKCDLEIRETAYLLNISADQLRTKYLEFIAQLPQKIQHKGQNLKEWFAIDGCLSAWWLSLIAEKNTFKSEAFNRLVQLETILSILKKEKIDFLLFASKSQKLQNALKAYVQKHGISFRTVPARILNGMKDRMKELQRGHYLKHALHVLFFAVCQYGRFGQIRRAMKGIPRRMRDPDQLMLVGPYPYFDTTHAQAGVFKNKLYSQLQEALERGNRKIVWALFNVQNGSCTIPEALQYARDFIKKGYNIYFLEESCSMRRQIKVLMKLFFLGIKFLRVENAIARAHNFEDCNFYSLFKDDWHASFVGAQGYQGLLFYEMFKELLKNSQAKQCLYCCEMHAWEKALLAAREVTGSNIPFFAYQHATVSSMLLNYFNSPMETRHRGAYPLAQPDKIICNGELPYQYMLESGWPKDRLMIAEAIRFEDLKIDLPAIPAAKENIVVVAFSISPQESSAILATVYQALKDVKEIKVWIKPHPFVNLDDVLRLAGLRRENFPFEIRGDSHESLLAQAKIVIVGESSVSLIALALGCEIVLVNVPEWINMSPLRNIAMNQIRTVNSPDELGNKVLELCRPGMTGTVPREEIDQVINKFFYFNKNSDVPQKLLELLEVQI